VTRGGSAEITLDVSPQTAWEAIVSPRPRRWYYRLTPHGDFVEGARVRWSDSDGTAAEESEVMKVEAPGRLVLRSRLLYSPALAAQPPHTLTWEVTKKGGGCSVRMSWRASEMVAGLLGAEAGNLLKGLRLEHDAAAQAEIARKPDIGPVAVEDLTPERLRDYQSFFDHDAFRDFPGWQSCYCMETHRTQTDEEWAVRTARDNRRDMSAMIADGKVTALLAYAEGKPVGWCNYGETSRLNGVMHRFGLSVAGQQGFGSIACFVIAAPYRGHGVATRLLEAALERLRGRGVKVAEAYPAKELESAQANYRGPLGMYTAAGFTVHRETGRHLIVRKTL
jgi:ribosomal protein S18 acetylase RimI-like enzyme/uncharacterized protein YndB with AHSA1/START domain